MTETQARRDTRQRRVILQAVEQLGCHPTAEQIYDSVRVELPGTSLSTVYRNLGILVEQGEILPLRGCGQEVHYDHRTHEHYHAQCRICGRVKDIPLDMVKADAILTLDFEGFAAENVVVTVTGVCSRCGSIDVEREEKV